LRKSSKSELSKLLKVSDYWPFWPHDKQLTFLILNQLDVFFGGSAGGGKSAALLLAALQYVDVPGYNALIIRDTFRNLAMKDSIMDLSFQWLNDTDAKWLPQEKRWEFPSGATLTFGYMDGPLDHLNYKGPRFQFIGIDEASDLRWNQIIYMFSRLGKATGQNIPLRMRLASNPGGRCHDQLKARYISPETRENRLFVPSRLADNPGIDAETYIKSLDQLDPVTRKQLLDGDWDIRESGRMFRRQWFKIIEGPMQYARRVRCWDMAATEADKNKDPDFTVGCLMGITPDKQYVIDHIVRGRWSPQQSEKIIRQTAEADGNSVRIYIEQEGGSSGKAIIDHYRRNVLAGFAMYGVRPSGSKINRAMPVASQAEAGNIFIRNGLYLNELLDELDLFPDGSHDDQIDSVSACYAKLTKGGGDVRARWI